MDKPSIIIIEYYPRRHWDTHLIRKDEVLIATVNRFHKVTDDFIILYETLGGTGTGYTPGNVTHRIYIGDCEVKTETKND